jgi:hypothetical protein
MLLTKKSGAAPGGARSPFVHSLHRGLSQALPTMDRRAFLRRSGLGVGVGLAASSLTLVKKSQAATPGGVKFSCARGAAIPTDAGDLRAAARAHSLPEGLPAAAGNLG